MKNDEEVAVIYLSWIPYGSTYFLSFINSYKIHTAGHVHKLVILFNGVNDNKDIMPFLKIANEENLIFEHLVLKSGFDIDAYYFAAEKINNKIIFFLNTYSEILCNDWLKKIYTAFIQPGVGLAGATGSFQSHYSTIISIHKWKYEPLKSFYENYRKYKLLLKTYFLYSFYFKSFPNPHLRTNAFMIQRDIFLKLNHKKNKIKMDAYRFESSRNSLTNQIKKAGYIILVVDKNGKWYKENDWYISNTFWSKNQENLLIMDNQTMKYMHADENKKKWYTNLAWGPDQKKF